jgi:hypothetical protein
LTREELQLVVEGSRFHASVPPDFISEQIPAPGTTLKKGRSVRVWVSLGPQKHTVPRIEERPKRRSHPAERLQPGPGGQIHSESTRHTSSPRRPRLTRTWRKRRVRCSCHAGISTTPT